MWPPKKKMLAPTLNDCSELKKRKQQAATQEVECLVCPSSCCWSTVTDWLKVWLEFRDPPGKKNTQTQHNDSTRPGDPTQPGVGLGWVGSVLHPSHSHRRRCSRSLFVKQTFSPFVLLCTRSPPVINRTFLPQPSHTPFFSQHDGLLFSLSFSHLSSNAGTLSLPLIYHFLLPLSSLSLAISLPVRLCSPLSDFLSGSVTLILFLLSSSSSSSLPLPEDPPPRPAPVAPPAPRSITHVHATRTPLAHSYSTCVSLLGVAWGNQIHLQIYLYILIPSLTQGLFFSLFFSSPHCVFGQVSEYNGSLFLFSFF